MDSAYAWFAAHTRVSATGMSVTAQTEGGIQIKVVSATANLGDNHTADWATTADAEIQSTALYPASNICTASNGVITSDWIYAKAALANASTAKEDTYVKLGTVADKYTFTNGVASGNGILTYVDTVPATTRTANNGRYYLATTYNISNVSSTVAKDLKVEGVTVTGNTNSTELDKSLRVAVVCGSNVAIYAPIGYTTAPSYKVATNTDGTPIAKATTTTMSTSDVPVILSTVTSGVISAEVGTEDVPTVVNVYIWYEGEDSNHKTDNITTNIDGLNVTVNFIATV